MEVDRIFQEVDAFPGSQDVLSRQIKRLFSSRVSHAFFIVLVIKINYRTNCFFFQPKQVLENYDLYYKDIFHLVGLYSVCYYKKLNKYSCPKVDHWNKREDWVVLH